MCSLENDNVAYYDFAETAAYDEKKADEKKAEPTADEKKRTID